MARQGAKMWMKHGALDYKECVGDDMKVKFGLPFPKLMKLKAGEVPVFSFIVYRSRAHRDRVNAKVMKDPRMGEFAGEMPFDCKRMGYGGFFAFTALLAVPALLLLPWLRPQIQLATATPAPKSGFYPNISAFMNG